MTQNFHSFDPKGDVELVIDRNSDTLLQEHSFPSYDSGPQESGEDSYNDSESGSEEVYDGSEDEDQSYHASQGDDEYHQTPEDDDEYDRVTEEADDGTGYLAQDNDSEFYHNSPHAQNGSDQDPQDDPDPEPDDSESSQSEEEELEQSDQQIRYQVSSKILSTASRYFNNLFNGSFREAHELQEQGFVRGITTENCETEAQTILLSIFHCNTIDVPLEIDIGTALEIAILIDKWDCFQAVSFHAKVWNNYLTVSFLDEYSNEYSSDILAWICVAWIFWNEALFVKATAAAIKWANGTISNPNNLPIPEFIFWELNRGLYGRGTMIKHCLRVISNRYRALAFYAGEHSNDDLWTTPSATALTKLVTLTYSIGLSTPGGTTDMCPDWISVHSLLTVLTRMDSELDLSWIPPSSTEEDTLVTPDWSLVGQHMLTVYQAGGIVE
jgi:hypothetical protein